MVSKSITLIGSIGKVAPADAQPSAELYDPRTGTW